MSGDIGILSGEQGYKDAYSYFTNPSTTRVPDELHHMYLKATLSYILYKMSTGGGGGGSGDVNGPTVAVDANFALFNGTTGKVIADSGKKASDFDASGAASGVQSNLTGHQNATGAAVHGLSTMATQSAGAVNITGGSISGASLSGTTLTTTSAAVVGVNAITTTGGTTAGSASDHVVAFIGTNTHTYTLPACMTGRTILLKNLSTGIVTVNRAGSDTMDGSSAAWALSPADAVTFIGNGTNWMVF